MNIEEFKTLFSIEKIELKTCKESDRLRAADSINGRTMLTVVEFDPKKPVYVYECQAEDGTDLYILSNVEPFEGELVATL